MSEVEAPQDIVPSKSEDKLEIEKEEQDDKQKAEDIVGEMFTEEKKEEKKEEAKSEEQEKPKEEAASEEKKGEEPVEESEKKDEEKTESKEKKFNMPKIKAPKIINEIRSRSKSREKKKVIFRAFKSVSLYLLIILNRIFGSNNH